MKHLAINGEVLTSEKIYKGDDYIKGDGFEFRGISDFSGYSLGEGEAWDIPEPTDAEKLLDLQLALAELVEGGM